MPAPPHDRRTLKWNGWGWTQQQFTLDDPVAFWGFVRRELRTDRLPDTPPVDLDEATLPDVQLPPEIVQAIKGAFAPGQVQTSRFERAFHAMGRSYHDLIRLRAGRIESAPDVVVYPESHEDVERAVALAATHDLALIPFGGGSSVVGGVEAAPGTGQRGVITLDTSRMRQLLDLSAENRTATFQAGIYGPALEQRLQEEGFTLGHFPQSFEFSTLGGWIAARGAGQYSDRYGKAEDFLVQARVVSPQGAWRTSAAPASATGPDLNAVIAGSEGALGVITEATVDIHPAPATEKTYAFLFRHFASGLQAARELRQTASLPLTMLRLSDADETRFLQQFRGQGSSSLLRRLYKKWLTRRGFADEPALMMVGLAGDRWTVAEGAARALQLCVGHGGAFAGSHGDMRANHYRMPYLRDDLMDHGVGVDTMETATSWSNVRALHRGVRTAIRTHTAQSGTHCAVLSHLSHSYSDGACLYFTLIFPMAIGAEVEQWRALKSVVSEAILDGGGTLSHHHGVGRDHQPWLETERGALSVGIVRSTKSYLDPSGLMNPGTLIS